MVLISHRGNINGVNLERENDPNYISETLSLGYDVEIDLWIIDNKLYLGHDNPTYITNIEFISNENIWIHCKNIDGLLFCKENISNNYFWHQTDVTTLTSNNYLWTYPGNYLTKYSIAVMPEIKQFNNIEISYGICSDYIKNYKYLNDNNKINGR